MDYLYTLTDDVGIFQHSKFSVPDPTEGYTTDDNVRALIVAGMLYEKSMDKKYLSLVNKYLSFTINAQNAHGKFKNFMDYDRNFIEDEGSDDCFGRCIWALGYLDSMKDIPDNIKNCCIYMIEQALPNALNLKFLRSKAYTIIGICYILQENESKKYKYNLERIYNKDKLISILKDLCNDIMIGYAENNNANWKWFENKITYSNSIFPWALISSYKFVQNDMIRNIAIESFKFLDEIYFRKGYFKPIGCKGWMKKEDKPAEFDEQPIEACESLIMYLKFYDFFGNKFYLDRASDCFEWYRGKNSKNFDLIDEDSGGCFDGINENGVNFNEGSESTISYLMAYLALSKYAK